MFKYDLSLIFISESGNMISFYADGHFYRGAENMEDYYVSQCVWFANN